MTEILAYGPVGGWYGVNAAQVVEALRRDPKGDVTVRIHSDGGDALEGVAIANALRTHQGKITAYVDGVAASAASMIAMGADEVVMAESAVMMLHAPWGLAIGDGGSMRETADALDAIGRAYVAGYAAKTRRPEAEMRELMTRYSWQTGTWLTATDAVREKLADRIGPSVAAQARADKLRASAYEKIPAAQAAPQPAGKPPAQQPVKGKRGNMPSAKEWAARLKAAATDEARATVLAEMEQDDPTDKSDQAQALQARIAQAQAAREKAEAAAAAAKAEADKLKYEDAIRSGKADRKINGPAHEATVRANNPTLAELQRYLASAQQAPELTPDRPAGAAGLSATDRLVYARLQQVAPNVNEATFAAAGKVVR